MSWDIPISPWRWTITLMRITPPQRRRWTGWRRSSKPPFLLRFYYFSTPSEAPKCHDMRGIFRNAKCRKCLIFQAIPTFAKWCQDNQKIGRTFPLKNTIKRTFSALSRTSFSHCGKFSPKLKHTTFSIPWTARKKVSLLPRHDAWTHVSPPSSTAVFPTMASTSSCM